MKTLLCSLWVCAETQAAPFPLQITELMYNPLDGREYEFVEIFNSGTNPIDLSEASWSGIDFSFEEGAVIQPGHIWVIASNDDPEAFEVRHPGVTPYGYFGRKLSNGGERLALSNSLGHTIAWVTYEDGGFWPSDADGFGYSLERVDLADDPNSPTAWRRSVDLNGSPGRYNPTPSESPVRISEFFAASNVEDPNDVDFLELWNPSAESIDLSGWRLSDTEDDLGRFIFPPGTVIGPTSRLSLSLTNETSPTSAGFRLNADGETVFVYDSLGQTVDSVRFGQQVLGFSVSRIGEDWHLSVPTPGAENMPAAVADQNRLSINEWKADAEEDETDWIELYNTDPELPMSLSGLRLGIGDTLELPPEEVVIVPFNDEWNLYRGTTSPTPENPIAWTKSEFIPEGWEQLTAPFFSGPNPGEGTELVDMMGNYTSVLIRKEFNIIDRDQYQIYHVKFRSDDGFTGWFNGSEWGRLNFPAGVPTVNFVSRGDSAGDFRERTFEFDNFAIFLDEGPNVIAIQAISSELNDDDFLIDFSLTGILPPESAFLILKSSPLSSLSFIPPNGHLLLNASEGAAIDDLQFRLPVAGTTLALINSEDELITSAVASIASEGASEGRSPDGADQIKYFIGAETPGGSNVTDFDNDGILDEDERLLGLNPEDPADALADLDNDGVSNLDEYRYGTDLNDPTSFFALRIQAVLPDGTLQLLAPRLLDKDYRIEFTEDLRTNTWKDLVEVESRDEDEPASMSIDVPIEQSMAFFRMAGVEIRTPSRPLSVTLSPVNSQDNHQPNQSLQITLTEPLEPESLNSTDAWQLTDEFGRSVEIEARFDGGFTQITLFPRLPLRNNAEYQVSISPEVSTVSGKSLATEIGDWRFGTAPSAELIDDRSVYSQDNDDSIRIDVTVIDGETPYTLDDLHADISKDDDFEPFIRVRVEGEDFTPSLGGSNGTMKLRGATSRLSRQKSYRIELDADENDWRGHRYINLMKHPYDLSRIRNRLSYEMFENIQHTTSLRTQFVHLTINGTSFGLFTQVERYDQQFLETHGLDPEGHLYKAEASELRRYPNEIKLNEDPEYDEETFETRHEIKGNNDHTKLIQMLEDINNLDLDFDRLFDQHFNRENYLTWMAFNLLTDNDDSTSQNYMLYSPSDTRTWYFLPWDYDGAWGFHRQPIQSAGPRWREGISNYWNVPLHRRFMSIERNRLDLERRMTELRTTLLTEENVQSVLATYKGVVKTFVTASPDNDRLPTVDKSSLAARAVEWEGDYDSRSTEPPLNEATYYAALQRPMPIHLGAPKQDDASTSFRWAPSHHLLGTPFTYDLEVSTSPEFEATTIVAQELGLTEVTFILSPGLPPGDYFYRVRIRSQDQPDTNWQISFTSYHDAETGETYDGMRSFSIPEN